MIALFLTLIFPGLGHFYYGKTKKTLILAGISFIPFVLPFSLIYALYDINKLNKSGISPELSKREAITVILFTTIVPFIFWATLAITIPKIYTSVIISAEDISNPKINRKNMNDIASVLEITFDKKNKYPDDLSEIIRDNPMRKKWETDPWGNRYIYETDAGKSSFKLVSIGKDREENTGDDIIITSILRE